VNTRSDYSCLSRHDQSPVAVLIVVYLFLQMAGAEFALHRLRFTVSAARQSPACKRRAPEDRRRTAWAFEARHDTKPARPVLPGMADAAARVDGALRQAVQKRRTEGSKLGSTRNG
jgi:hypothetical protein